MSAHALVQNLGELAGFCEDEYDEGLDEHSAETRAIILAALRDARADLGAFEKRVEADLLAISGKKRFVVEGLGEVEIRKRTKRTIWDNDGLTRVLVALALDERKVNEQTGEYEPAHEAVARVLSDCARPSWRVTPLRARGLQVDEWCCEEPDGWSVQLPPRRTP